MITRKVYKVKLQVFFGEMPQFSCIETTSFSYNSVVIKVRFKQKSNN